MKSNLEEILEKIPDFEQFLEVASEIRQASLNKMLLEKEIKAGEAKVFRKAMTDEQYQVNGKAPAVSYVDSAYKHTGLDGELLPLRESLIEATAELDELKLRLEVYKSMLDVWRTLSANERSI